MKKTIFAVIALAVLGFALCVYALAADMLAPVETEQTEIAATAPEELQDAEQTDAQDEAMMLDGEEEMPVELYGVEGEIVEIGEGYVVLSTQMHGMVQINFTEETVFEGVTQEGLAVGQYLFADYNGMMSRSIPAQITGLRVYAVMLSGVVSEVGEGSVTILQDETGMEIVIHLPETAGQLAAGDHITAATNGAMTMSLPPQTSAAQIVVNGK